MATNNANPWKGLDSYKYSDRSIFHGRESESIALIETILNNRFTIIYGPSGVGKSSLLNAGVRPKLSSDKFFIIDISMRELDLQSKTTLSSQIITIVRFLAQKKHIDISPLSLNNNNNLSDSLWFFFHANEFWSQTNNLLTPILIIDQFEDIFKEEVSEQVPRLFFNELDELSNVVPPLYVRDRIEDIDSFRYNNSAEFRFVCSLREDYLPRLDDYVYSLNISELKKSRFGITLMNPDQARKVILGPANGIVSESVANKIISILSTQSSRNRIEPFLLSLFMYRVYIKMTNYGLSIISDELINKIGLNVVNDYYIESMKKVSLKAMKHLENVLLTPKGHRDSISYEKLMESEKVTNEEINTLLGARILKKNSVNNVVRLEFTHDILSKYAQKNKERREHNNKEQHYLGYCGGVLTLIIAIIIGIRMSHILSYFSIPIIIVLAIITTFYSFNIKFLSKKDSYKLLLYSCFIGVLIDLSQIIPVIGFILLGISYWFSFSKLKKYSEKHLFNNHTHIKYSVLAIVWGYAFVVLPIICFGYNIFQGMQYSRSEKYSSNLFYIKDFHGQYGLRNRTKIILTPQFDEKLVKVNNGNYVAKNHKKYGLIDSNFKTIMNYEFDKYVLYNNHPYFYKNGKEIADNGLRISWAKSVSNSKKEILRKIVANMVKIEGGAFMMGANYNKTKKDYDGYKPQYGEDNIHKVILTDFYFNKYEVTLEDWITIMDYDPRNQPEHIAIDSINNLKIPVYKVSYEDCLKFVEQIKRMTGLNFALPTEAQWEYVARGGKNSNTNYYFAGSNSEYEVGWIGRNSGHMPHEVGTKKPYNRIYDLTGNMAEFCLDCLSSTFYSESAGKTNPLCSNGDKQNNKKLVVCRGGSYDSNQPENYFVTRRKKAISNIRYRSIGLRLAIN